MLFVGIYFTGFILYKAIANTPSNSDSIFFILVSFLIMRIDVILTLHICKVERNV